MGFATTRLVSHGDINSVANERYGESGSVLRIGNGGAGATGLLKILAEDYCKISTKETSIEWVCNHSRNTQLALLHGYIDIGLTYERDQESLTADEGWSITVGCAFHDHFCLAGPVSDPANVRSAPSLLDAFKRIARSGVLFHSRGDSSATMWKERSLWSSCGIDPKSETDDWYKTSLFSPAEALTTADAAGAYLLTDRSTLLRQTLLETIHNTTVFFEPTSTQDVLMNSCYALIPTETKTSAITWSFLKYLFSARGQKVISSYGERELGGFPLFASVAEGYAQSFLRGGLPRDGQWKILENRSRL